MSRSLALLPISPARVHVTVCHPDDCGVLLSPSFTFVPSVYTAILSLGDISLSKSRNLDPVRPHASWPARSPSDLSPPRSGLADLAVAPATLPSRVFMPFASARNIARLAGSARALHSVLHSTVLPSPITCRAPPRTSSLFLSPSLLHSFTPCFYFIFLALPVIVYFILPFLPTEYKPHEGTEFFSEVPSYSPNAQNGIWCQTQKESKGFARNK